MRIGSITAAIALILALAAWYLRADFPAVPAPTESTHAAAPAPVLIAAATSVDWIARRPPRVSESPATPAVAANTSPDYAAQYLRAADLLSFLEALAPAAAAGDVDALYYLAVASRRCTQQYEQMFGPPEKEKTLEVALETDFWTRYYENLARKIHAQCRRFRGTADNAFAEWQNLLHAAAEAGSGPAKAALAFEMQNGMIRLQAPDIRAQLTSDIRTLAKEAIRTKDPQVLNQLALVATITGHAGSSDDVAGVWMLAACQRGLECGRDSEQFQFFCKRDPACQPSETLVDLFRRREGPKFDEMQRQANEINARLDADRFDEIIP